MTDLPALETPRLRLRALATGDAPFVLLQLNQAGWLRYIGDRGVRDLVGASRYLETQIVGHYRRHGHGMYGIELKEDGALVGMCGLLRRDYLPAPDLGFALLDTHAGRGLAREAATAVLHAEQRRLALGRVLAFCANDNRRSRALLLQLGFTACGTVVVPPGEQALPLFERVEQPPSRGAPDAAAPQGD